MAAAESCEDCPVWGAVLILNTIEAKATFFRMALVFWGHSLDERRTDELLRFP